MGACQAPLPAHGIAEQTPVLPSSLLRPLTEWPFGERPLATVRSPGLRVRQERRTPTMEPLALGIDATIFILSHVKYMAGVALAAGFRPGPSGFLAAGFGAASGTILWVYAGQGASRQWRQWRGNTQPRRVITPTRRMLVRLRRRNALMAIALLTPVLLSMPVGCALALSIEPRPRRVVVVVWASVLAWSVILCGARILLTESVAFVAVPSLSGLIDAP